MQNKFRHVNRTSIAEIDRRNAEVRARRAREARNAELSIATEAAWANKQKANEQYAKDRVPRVVSRICTAYERTMPEIVLREAFTNLVVESLVWDKEAIEENMDGIRYMSHKYIKSIGGLEAVKEAAIKNKSAYLEHMYNVCLEAGKKIAKRKSKAIKEKVNKDNVDEYSKNQIDFSINDSEQKELKRNLSDMDLDEIAGLVKDKVLTVVKDEETSQQKEDEFTQELQDAVNNAKGLKTPIEVNNGDAAKAENSEGGPDNTTSTDNGATSTADTGSADAGSAGGDASATTESFKQYARGRLELQPSFFRSMFARSYGREVRARASMESAANATTTIETEEKTHPGMPGQLNMYDIYLHDGDDDLSYIDFVKNSDETAIAGDERKISNEDILESCMAEAIAMYTIAECANTIKLISPTRREVVNTIHANYKALAK